MSRETGSLGAIDIRGRGGRRLADTWADVPGEPRVFMAYIGGVGACRQHCDQLAADGYTGFAFSSP